MKKQILTLLAMVTMTVVPLQMRADDIPINGTTFPDANFRNWVLAQDYGQDGVLTEAEIAGVTSMYVSNKNIASLKGIEYFKALTDLRCHGNQLTSLDVSSCTALWSIKCCSNRINETEIGKLVESLPTKYGYLTVKNLDGSNDQNVITITQVTAAKAKGWAVYTVDANGDEVIYHGVETSLNSITTGATGSTIDHYYTLDGVRHEGRPTQKGVYIVKDKKIAIK